MQSSNFQAAPVPAYEPEEKKMPLSMTSDMDVPYGDGTFDDSPRSRKPIVDPHAQSAAEYLDLRGGKHRLCPFRCSIQSQKLVLTFA